ncbi:MAG: hypothetical protein ACHP8A_20380 [Terriglobales bacterium]
MSWDRDPLWAKARLFFERASGRDDAEFGLWCSMGLELLARAAVASISPTLLADPDKDQKYLLYALKRGSEKNPRSIAMTQVLNLCGKLFPEFSPEIHTNVSALISRRNDELHSGNGAFQEYATRYWLTPFYRACDVLARAMGESLDTLFLPEEAAEAKRVLAESTQEVKTKVDREIGMHKGEFGKKTEEERTAATEKSKQEGEKLSHEKFHRVTCPSCGSVALVQGDLFGKETVTDIDGEIQVRQSVSPRILACSACGLKLSGYAELDAAGFGGSYSRTTTFSPEDYYGLVDPRDIDEEQIIQRYLDDMAADAAFDNE